MSAKTLFRDELRAALQDKAAALTRTETVTYASGLTADQWKHFLSHLSDEQADNLWASLSDATRNKLTAQSASTFGNWLFSQMSHDEIATALTDMPRADAAELLSMLDAAAGLRVAEAMAAAVAAKNSAYHAQAVQWIAAVGLAVDVYRDVETDPTTYAATLSNNISTLWSTVSSLACTLENPEAAAASYLVNGLTSLYGTSVSSLSDDFSSRLVGAGAAVTAAVVSQVLQGEDLYEALCATGTTAVSSLVSSYTGLSGLVSSQGSDVLGSLMSSIAPGLLSTALGGVASPSALTSLTTGLLATDPYVLEEALTAMSSEAVGQLKNALLLAADIPSQDALSALEDKVAAWTGTLEAHTAGQVAALQRRVLQAAALESRITELKEVKEAAAGAMQDLVSSMQSLSREAVTEMGTLFAGSSDAGDDNPVDSFLAGPDPLKPYLDAAAEQMTQTLSPLQTDLIATCQSATDELTKETVVYEEHLNKLQKGLRLEAAKVDHMLEQLDALGRNAGAVTLSKDLLGDIASMGTSLSSDILEAAGKGLPSSAASLTKSLDDAASALLPGLSSKLSDMLGGSSALSGTSLADALRSNPEIANLGEAGKQLTALAAGGFSGTVSEAMGSFSGKRDLISKMASGAAESVSNMAQLLSKADVPQLTAMTTEFDMPQLPAADMATVAERVRSVFASKSPFGETIVPADLESKLGGMAAKATQAVADSGLTRPDLSAFSV